MGDSHGYWQLLLLPSCHLFRLHHLHIVLYMFYI